ncbi:hypothetical protein TanjilG_27226 [Lupinus angustifolius]|uniref:Exostosin GT47 domain-containing protein n=1 Tax=Lupinus angustifolius TaxID=3871 RepID=A0A394D8A1_LUPAN|nr:hypothetical protein TanjilG_27226 [Lupinus angustifolius]
MLLFLISHSIFIDTFEIRSYFFPLLKPPTGSPDQWQPDPNAEPKPDPPLRVFMYDLPRRFNVGMINRRDTTETPVTVVDWPPWPENWGLKKQHSVEYWLMGSLIHEGEDGERREVVRVLDPEVADVFFVPFFSSLSFNTHGHIMTDPATEIDRKLQLERKSAVEWGGNDDNFIGVPTSSGLGTR